MNISYVQVRAFLRMLLQPQEYESDCEYYLKHVAEFAETADSGQAVPQELVRVDEHLSTCSACCEEFGFLKAALSDESVQCEFA